MQQLFVAKWKISANQGGIAFPFFFWGVMGDGTFRGKHLARVTILVDV